MQYGNRYFVRREQCWGGTYVWFVADRDRERSASWRAVCVGRQFKAERTAKDNCERANRDWQRFLRKAAAADDEGLTCRQVIKTFDCEAGLTKTTSRLARFL